MTRYLIYFALILFGPLIILFSRFVIGYFYQWVFPGPHKLNAVFRKNQQTHDWKITQRSFTALAGMVVYDFDIETLNSQRQKYTLMLELRAILGKVTIKIPEGMNLIIENRSFCSSLGIFERKERNLINFCTEEEKSKKNIKREIDLLISSRIIFGSLEIVRE